MAIQDELKLFVEEFKRTNGRISTQMKLLKAQGVLLKLSNLI